jgi:hypothetical protein
MLRQSWINKTLFRVWRPASNWIDTGARREVPGRLERGKLPASKISLQLSFRSSGTGSVLIGLAVFRVGALARRGLKHSIRVVLEPRGLPLRPAGVHFYGNAVL